MEQPSIGRTLERISATDDLSTRLALVGGIATDLMLLSSGVFHEDIKTINVDRDELDTITTLRSNGTVRDIDIKVFTSRPEICRSVQTELAARTSAPVSASGYNSKEIKNRRVRFTSEFIEENDETLSLRAGAICHNVDRKLIEDTWTVEANDGSVSLPVRSPYSHIGLYYTRYISGIKRKDTEKVNLLQSKLQGLSLSDSSTSNLDPCMAFQNDVDAYYSANNLKELLKQRGLPMLIAKYAIKYLDLVNFQELVQSNKLLGNISERIICSEQNGQFYA